MDKFFQETLMNCSKSKKEFDLLKEKTLKISQNAQHMFNIEFAIQTINLNNDKSSLIEFLDKIDKK